MDADFGGRRERRIGRRERRVGRRRRVGRWFLFGNGGGEATFLLFGEFEAFAVELEALFLEFVLLLPVLLGKGVLGDGAKVIESALEGAFGLGL
jgi:hypothetical protein